MTNEYIDIFLTHIDQSVQDALERVLTIDEVLASEDRDYAWHILSFALDVPLTWPHTQKLLLTLAPRMEQEGFWREWIPYMQKGVQQSLVLKDDQAEAELCFWLGNLYLLSGEFSTASELLECSLAIFEYKQNRIGQAKVLNRFAFLKRRQSQYVDALQLAEQALNLLEPTNIECANSFVVQGEVAFAESDWPEAEQHYRKALHLWEQSGETRKIIWGLRNLGVPLRAQEKYDEARICYERAIDLLARIHDPITLATVKMNLGAVYYTCEQYDKAQRLYFSAESVFRQTEDQPHLAMIYNNIGMNHRALQEQTEAIEAFEKSIAQWKRLGNVHEMCNVMDNLGEVHLDQGDWTTAISIFQDTLKRLGSIDDRQGLDRLEKIVTRHLHKAICNGQNKVDK